MTLFAASVPICMREWLVVKKKARVAETPRKGEMRRRDLSSILVGFLLDGLIVGGGGVV